VAASLKIALANAVLAIAVIAWIPALANGSARRPRATLLLPIAAYIIVSMLSALAAADPRHALGELADLLTLVLAPMTISLLDRGRWQRLMVALAVVLMVSASVGLWQYAHGADSIQNRLHGLADHYMTFAGWTLVVTLLLAAEVAFGCDRRRLAWAAPATAFGVLALALGFTRGAWIGLATGLALAVALARPRALLLSPFLGALLFLAVPQKFVDRISSSTDLNQTSTRERLAMLDAGLAMVRDHPLLGLGPGGVQPAFDDYRTGDIPERIPHLHNNPIQIAAERGLAGLVAYIAVLVVFGAHVRTALMHRSPATMPAIAGCLMAVVGVTVAGLFEYNWGDAEVWIVTIVSLSAPFALAPRETT
jgi:putative inorganic carbon (HCO3(-)) transporter